MYLRVCSTCIHTRSRFVYTPELNQNTVTILTYSCLNLSVVVSVEEVLKQGHVPPRQSVYVERKELTQMIRDKLYKLKDRDG